MSNRACIVLEMRHNNYFFGKRPEPLKTPDGSLGRKFEIRCLCGTVDVKIVADFDDEAGTRLFLLCKRCGAREEINSR